MNATDEAQAVPDYFVRVRLDGKAIIVLGSGQGIGRQICHALAQAGAALLCVDRDADCAARVAREVGGIPCVANVTARSDMEHVFDEASRHFQSLHGIVDIVGEAHLAAIEAIDDATYQRQIDVVFRHAWLAIQMGSSRLAAAGGGSIVFVGSLSGVTAAPNQSLYGAQKAALHHLAKCAAVEYGALGVRVNVVAPGATRTPRFLGLMEPIMPAIEEAIPLQTSAHPSDIAGAVLFLAGDLARHVTGQVLVVDGGQSATVQRARAQAGAIAKA